MENASLIVIDERIIPWIEAAASELDLQLTPLGPPSHMFNHDLVRHNYGIIPEDSVPNEFIINNISIDSFFRHLNEFHNTLENLKVIFLSEERSYWEGVQYSLVVCFKNTTREEPATNNHEWQAVPPPPPREELTPEPDRRARRARTPQPGDFLDEFTVMDETPPTNRLRIRTTPAEPDEQATGQIYTPEQYERELDKLRNLDMTLTKDIINHLSPFSAFNFNIEFFKDWLVENFDNLNRAIQIRSCAGTPFVENPKDPDTLFLFFFSTPDISATRSANGLVTQNCLVPPPHRDRGQSQPSRERTSTIEGFPPSNLPIYNEVVNIEDPTTKTVIAQLINQKYLYFLFHLTAKGSERELYIIKYIITTALASMSSLPSSIRSVYQSAKNQVDMDLLEIAEKRLKETVSRLFTGHFKHKIEETTNIIQRNERYIQDYSQTIQDNYRQLTINRTDLEGAKKALKELEKNIDIETFFNHPKIDKISATDSTVSIFTKHLFFTIPDNRLVFDLGKMEIQLRINGNALPLVFNKTHQFNGNGPDMHHPHGFEDGNPCWGNVQDTLTKLFNNGDIKSYIDVTIAFLETVNLRDTAGAWAYRWPLADESYQNRDDYMEIYNKATAHLEYSSYEEDN